MSSAVPTCLRSPVTLSRTTPRSTCASAGASMASQCARQDAAGCRCGRPRHLRRASGLDSYGRLQCWSAKFWHPRTSTWVPFTEEPLGSVRHRPLSASTYSPLDLCVQVWALWPLQVQITSGDPAPPWLTSSRHLPSTDSAPPEKVHFWDVVPLQLQMSTLLPRVVLPPKSSRHLPWSPVIGPVIAEMIVQVNDTEWCAPVTSVAEIVAVYTATVVGVPVTVPVEALMFRPAGSPMALQVSGLPAAEAPWIVRLMASPAGLLRLPGLVIETESAMAPVATHPFWPPLNDALLHSDSTAKGTVLVDRVR